jgi:hypothetical protein
VAGSPFAAGKVGGGAGREHDLDSIWSSRWRSSAEKNV